jgi:hypothetical protein
MSFDQRCFDLAVVFLTDEKVPQDKLQRHAAALAQEIQDAVESYIEFEVKK